MKVANLWYRDCLLKIAVVVLFTSLFSNVVFGLHKFNPRVDTTEIKLGKVRIFFVNVGKWDSLGLDSLQEINARHHWRGIDVGFSGYLINGKLVNLSGGGEDQWELTFYRSRSIRLNIIEKKFSLIEDHLHIVTGAGINFTSYFFKHNVDLISSDDFTFLREGTLSDPNQNKVIKRNKLKLTYAEVPLLLEMHSREGKSFHIAFGVIGGLKLGSKYKQSYTVDKTKYKKKRSDDFNISPIRLNTAVRCGYGRFTLFANYGITELFVKNKTNYELTPVSLGISLLGF